jgi:hypothetical protein
VNDESPETGAKRVGVELALDLTSDDQRNAAGLLGHDHRH